MAYEEMSPEEARGTIYHGVSEAPAPVVISQPTVGKPAAPSPKQAAPQIPDAQSLIKNVGQAHKALQEVTPAPKAPSAIDELSSQIVDNWKPLAIGAGAVAAAKIIPNVVRTLRDRTAKKETPTISRIEPTFATPEETAAFTLPEQPKPTVADLTAKNEAIKAAMAQQTPAVAQPPAGPTYNQPLAQVPGIAPNVPQVPVQAPAPAPVQAPVGAASAQPAAAPVTQAVETGGNVNQAIQIDVAKQLDAVESSVKGGVAPKIGRPAGSKNLTAEQRSMIQAGQQVAGGRNWLVNQFGADPAAYERYIAQYNQGQDYPNYKAAVASIGENLEGPPKQAFKKAVKPPSSQAGFIDLSAPTQLTPFGQGMAQVGRQVVGDLKMGAAALPFALATDVRQQDVGYKRELEAELKKAKDPARVQDIKDELQKLEEGRYLQAMYNRFVEKNVPSQYRPALSR